MILRIALLLCLLVCSCSREREFSGSVFIVTEGGDNIKLGLVTVSVIDEDVARRHVAEIFKAKTAESITIRDQIKVLQTHFHILTNLQSHDPAAFAADPKYLKNLKEIPGRCSALERDMNSVTDFRDVANNLPNARLTTKTDADGNFHISLPGNRRIAVVASGSRRIPYRDSYLTEHYEWFVWTSARQLAGTKLLLSNDNLLSKAKPFDLLPEK